MDEVVTLFPSEYIHIGGDEARYSHWNKCKHCQTKMKAEGLKTSQQLQGWAEILECEVSNKTGIMP